MARDTAVGLRIVDLDEPPSEFRGARTTYFQTVYDALEAAEEYPLDRFRLTLVWERRTARGWQVVASAEVQE